MPFTTLPTVEAFGNNDVTTVAALIGIPDTVITATSIAGFPTDGQFRLLIDSELLLVTGYDPVANQWQVVRGIENTTPATHTITTQIACVLTRGSLLALKMNTILASGTTFIYRDSEPNPAGNVYATWAEAYAAAAQMKVPAIIVIDDTLNACQIPASSGDFDLHQITLSGLGTPFNNTLIVQDGNTFNEGILGVRNGLVLQVSLSVTPSLCTFTGTATNLTIDEGSVVFVDGSGYIFDLSGMSGGNFTLFVGNGFAFGNGSGNEFLNLGANGSVGVQVYMGDYSNNEPYFVAGTNNSARITLNVSAGASAVVTNFPSFFGMTNTSTSFGTNASLLNPFTVAGTPFPTPTNPTVSGQSIANIATGTMLYDSYTSTPYWWNGSTWGTFPVFVPLPINTTSPPTTLTSWDMVLVDVSGGAPPTLTMPSGPDDLDRIIITNNNGSFATYACPVNANAGQLMEDPSSAGIFRSSISLNVGAQSVEWFYDTSNTRWKILNSYPSSGGGSSNEILEQFNFTYTTSSPVTLLALEPGYLLEYAGVEITTTFDDPTANLSLGTTGNPMLQFAPGAPYLGHTGTTLTQVLTSISSATNYVFTLNPGASTQGIGVLVYRIKVA